MRGVVVLGLSVVGSMVFACGEVESAVDDGASGEGANAAVGGHDTTLPVGRGGLHSGGAGRGGTHAGAGGDVVEGGTTGVLPGASGAGASGDGGGLPSNEGGAGSPSGGAGGGETPGGAGAGGGGSAEPLEWPTSTRPSWNGVMSTSAVCSVHGICWNVYPASNNDLYGVWQNNSLYTWVAGAGGTLARHDSSTGQWRGVTGLGVGRERDFTFRVLRGGYYDRYLWAVGWAEGSSNQTLYRFDGTSWEVVPAPSHRVRGMWTSGAGDLWTTNEGHVVSFWNGAQWTETNVGKDVSGIWGFSSSDIWVSGETVLHFDGADWHDMGGGGTSIWGASSGDMWTGNGAHLESGVWIPYASEGTDLDLVVGKNANSVFFRGTGATPRNHFFDGKTLAPAKGLTNAQDIWPDLGQSYWFVGQSESGSLNVAYGWPQDYPVRPSFGHVEPGPEPEPEYKTIGSSLLQKVGNGYIEIKKFDADIVGSKALAFSDSDIWVCVAGKLQHHAHDVWTALDSPCEALQLADDGKLWVLAAGATTDRVRVFDGRAWQTLSTPIGFVARDFAVRFHEAWLLGTTTALRRSGDHWDEYVLGVDPTHAPKSVTITHHGELYFDLPNLYFAGTLAL